MKTAHIIYRNYFLPNGEAMSIGGIQTYLTNLVDVLNSMGFHCILYQRGDIDFHNVVRENFEVFGFQRPVQKVRGLNEMIYSRMKPKINAEADILIFGCESMAIKTKGVKTFAIQHGISWDIPEEGLSKLQYAYRYLKKQYDAFRTIKRIEYVDNLICVDCNFINWYKAIVPCPKVTMHYIPNFSELPVCNIDKPSTKDGVNIIFARRFVPQRGTRLFMKAIVRILTEYNNVNVTIAGDGEDEKLLKNNLSSYKNVKFIRYQSNESLDVHADKHIAVVPTLGSEGTSLSLLEAMASHCAVICTNVGGMTNIVINKYNGLMIAPEEDELYNAIKLLLDNDKLRCELADKAYETLSNSFNLSRWKECWNVVLSCD